MSESTESSVEKMPSEIESLNIPGLREQIDKLRKLYPELEESALRRILRLPDTAEES